MTAALVGWYVELAKLEPAFAAPGEHPEEALARVKPLLVILIDSHVEEAMSDLLAARAVKRGVGIALFGSGSEMEDEIARRWAAGHQIPFFHLPLDLESFGRVLDQAARTGATDRRVAERRSRPAVDRAIDGTLVLHDNAGNSWYIYDRRAGDRRAQLQPFRAFVSPDGVERRCALDVPGFAVREPAALIEQLARATQVPPNHS